MNSSWLLFNLANVLPPTTSDCRLEEVHVYVEVSNQEQISCASSILEVTRTGHTTGIVDPLQIRPTPLSSAERAYLRRAVENLSSTTRQKRQAKARSCSKRMWTLNWTDLPGWDFIIAPTSIEMNLCSGSCDESYRLPEGREGQSPTTTNHAIIRESWRKTIGSPGNRNISEVQCVPITLAPLTLLTLQYKKERSTAEQTAVGEMRKGYDERPWPNIVALRCGCR